MVDPARVQQLVCRAFDEVSEELALDEQISQSPDRVLYGEGGVLDSLGLVSLIVEIEAAVTDEYGVTLSLANNRALSQKNSPFRTVGTLVDYVVDQVEEAQAKEV